MSVSLACEPTCSCNYTSKEARPSGQQNLVARDIVFRTRRRVGLVRRTRESDTVESLGRGVGTTGMRQPQRRRAGYIRKSRRKDGESVKSKRKQ